MPATCPTRIFLLRSTVRSCRVCRAISIARGWVKPIVTNQQLKTLCHSITLCMRINNKVSLTEFKSLTWVPGWPRSQSFTTCFTRSPACEGLKTAREYRQCLHVNKLLCKRGSLWKVWGKTSKESVITHGRGANSCCIYDIYTGEWCYVHRVCLKYCTATHINFRANTKKDIDQQTWHTYKR